MKKLPPWVKAGRALRLVGWIMLVCGLAVCAAILIPNVRRGPASAALPPMLTLASVISVVSCLYIFTGIGLMHKKTWARFSGLLIAFSMLFAFPVGTIFALYLGWCLLKGWNEPGESRENP